MIEYRTQPLEVTVLLEELSFYCQVLANKGIETTNVMFGWDSNLDIDDMWHEMSVPRKDVADFVLSAERAGTVMVGRSDIFVSAGGLEFTLCHESDVHIKATEDAASEFFDRWKDKGYSPYVRKNTMQTALPVQRYEPDDKDAGFVGTPRPCSASKGKR